MVISAKTIATITAVHMASNVIRTKSPTALLQNAPMLASAEPRHVTRVIISIVMLARPAPPVLMLKLVQTNAPTAMSTSIQVPLLHPVQIALLVHPPSLVQHRAQPCLARMDTSMATNAKPTIIATAVPTVFLAQRRTWKTARILRARMADAKRRPVKAVII